MRALSIMYHDVVEGGNFDASGFPGAGAAVYKLDKAEFRLHLAAIREAIRDKTVEAADRLAAWDDECPLFLTFDDGGASAVATAGMLEEQRWPGHFFITTDRIGQPGFLAREQVREIRMRGHVIGSHSCSHPTRMAKCGWEQLVYEWTASSRMLSDLLGEPVTVASVPGGYYSTKVAEAADQAGIRTLFTSEPTTSVRTVNGCRVLGRYAVQRGMAPEASGRLAAGRLRPRIGQVLLWNVKKAGKLATGPVYLVLRELILTR